MRKLIMLCKWCGNFVVFVSCHETLHLANSLTSYTSQMAENHIPNTLYYINTIIYAFLLQQMVQIFQQFADACKELGIFKQITKNDRELTFQLKPLAHQESGGKTQKQALLKHKELKMARMDESKEE